MTFTYAKLVVLKKSKLTNKIQDFFYFEIVINRVFHERSKIAFSLTEHLKFPEKYDFHMCQSVNSGKSK